MERDSETLHAAAAIVTWAVVFGASLFAMHSAGGRDADELVVAAIHQVVILILIIVATSDRLGRQKPIFGRLVLLAMLLAVLILGWRIPVDFLQIYTIIWIAIAPRFFSRRTCFVLLFVVVAAWYAIARFSWQENDAIVAALLFGTFHFFALLSSLAAMAATEAKERSQQLNRELMATQHLLAEASRQSERTRIARDLHDLLGHHLTALTINLQVAGHLTEGDAKEKIDQCHALSKLLLNDVRDAVTTIREESAVDFTATLKLIVDNVPNLKVNLDIDSQLNIEDVNVAEALLRCIQEAITNTLRHSGAQQSWIRIWCDDGELRLSFRDDGKISKEVVPGNGLSGMRERIDRLGGEFAIDSLIHLQINIQIPLAR